jgi:hypothetical protein
MDALIWKKSKMILKISIIRKGIGSIKLEFLKTINKNGNFYIVHEEA